MYPITWPHTRAWWLRAQVHGFPKVMGVLTHLDGFKDTKRLKKTKKALKHRFWAEIYQGAVAYCWESVVPPMPCVDTICSIPL